MSDDPRREPPADLRMAARNLRDLYLSLQREGFTSQEALAVVGQVIAANRPQEGR